MKRFFKVLFVCLLAIMSINYSFAAISKEEKKQQIIALYNANKLDEAYTMISSMTEDERDYELWYILGNISQDYGNADNAIFFFQKATILNPDLGQKQYKDAKAAFLTAIKLNANEPDFYYNLAFAYKNLGEKEKAQKYLDIYNKMKES